AADRLAAEEDLSGKRIGRHQAHAKALEILVGDGQQRIRHAARLVDLRVESRKIDAVEDGHVTRHGGERRGTDVDLARAHQADDLWSLHVQLGPALQVHLYAAAAFLG